jgi:hypothetical protein
MFWGVIALNPTNTGLFNFLGKGRIRFSAPCLPSSTTFDLSHSADLQLLAH